MRLIAQLAATAAVALTLSAGAAFADDDELEKNWTPTIEEPADTLFDLGVDVAPVPKTPAAVQRYLSSLAPLTRSVILSTCEHYMETPGAAQERETLAFCSIAVGG